MAWQAWHGMTDRFHALTVVLAESTRDDDIQPLIEAIGQMRGVIAVTGHVAGFEIYAAEERARQEIIRRLFEHVRDPL